MTRIEAIMAIAEVMGRNGEALDPETTMSLDGILETAYQHGVTDGRECVITRPRRLGAFESHEPPYAEGMARASTTPRLGLVDL